MIRNGDADPVPLKVGYLVHDLNDPAVARRTLMLRDGGATLTLAGFRRGAQRIAQVAGAPAIEIGRSHDARFVSRLLSIALALLTLLRWRAPMRGVDVLIARNLEMLVVGRALRALSRRRPTLVYEVLDVHRLLLAPGWLGRALRSMERWLARPVDRLIVSSPAFLSAYYVPRDQVRAPALLIENKVLAEPDNPPTIPFRPAGPPWRIGWFGMIRCQRSLQLLKALCDALPGLVSVDIRGRVAETEFVDFHGDVASTPAMRFLGPYKASELGEAYGMVHFVWAVDFFEAGMNSAWLLPNRLYEGQWYGAVPLAEAGVETGRWLERQGAGVRFSDIASELQNFFSRLRSSDYEALVSRGEAIPKDALACGVVERCALVAEFDQRTSVGT